MAKITALPALDPQTIDGTETLPVVKDAATVRATLGQLAQPTLDATALLRDQAADLVLPQNIFIDMDLAEVEAELAEGTFFKLIDSNAGVADVRRRTSDGSALLYSEATVSALSSPNPGKGAGMVAGAGKTVADRATMAALTSAADRSRPLQLIEEGRDGIFVWVGSDLSAAVATDVQEGLFVAPASDPTGANGAWARQFSGAASVKWFGVSGLGIVDDTTAFAGAVAGAKLLNVPIWLPRGIYRLPVSSTIDISGIPEINGEDAVLDFSGASIANAMRADGQPVLVASAVAIQAGGTIPILISKNDLKVGDTLLVVSNEQTPAGDVDSANYKGQRTTVVANDGEGTVIVTPPLLDDYAAAELYRSDENRIRLGKGVTLLGNPDATVHRTGLYLNFCNATVEGHFRGFTGAACTFTNSQGLFLGSAKGMPNTVNNGYGVSADDLTDLTVLAVITAARHCVKSGGGAYWKADMVGGSGAAARIFPARLSVAGGQYFSHILQAIDAHSGVEALNVSGAVQCGPISAKARFNSIGAVTIYADGTVLGGGRALILGETGADWCDVRVDGARIEFRGQMPQNTAIIEARDGGKRLSLKGVTISGANFNGTGGIRRPIYIDGRWGKVDLDDVSVRYAPGATGNSAIEMVCYSGGTYRFGRIDTGDRGLVIRAAENGVRFSGSEMMVSSWITHAVDFRCDAGATEGYEEIILSDPRIEGAAQRGVTIAKAKKVIATCGYIRNNGNHGLAALLTKDLVVRGVDLSGNGAGAAISQTDYGTGSTQAAMLNDYRGSGPVVLGAGVTVNTMDANLNVTA